MNQSNKGILSGIRFFLVHLCVEVICFMTFRRHYDVVTSTLFAFVFDAFAFVPQGLFGEFMDKHRKVPMALIGVAMMGLGVLMTGQSAIRLLGFVVLGLGNAILHEQGALETVAKGEGKIFPTALFVSGGSFGVVIGQTMGKLGMSLWWLVIPFLAMVLLLVTSGGVPEDAVYPEFDCVRCGDRKLRSADFPIGVILLVAFFVTMVRSYMGYAVPISWKKEIWQDFLLFFIMGFGKAMGGFLVDLFGARKVGVLSTLLAIPFLCAGKDYMVISVIGVCLFSMTMCITFAMILSVLPKNPGMSFGITTIALFMGIVPIFFVRFGTVVNIGIIIVFSLLCSVLLYFFCNDKLPGRAEQ